MEIKSLCERKLDLIKFVIQIDDEEILNALEKLFERFKKSRAEIETKSSDE